MVIFHSCVSLPEGRSPNHVWNYRESLNSIETKGIQMRGTSSKHSPFISRATLPGHHLDFRQSLALAILTAARDPSLDQRGHSWSVMVNHWTRNEGIPYFHN